MKLSYDFIHDIPPQEFNRLIKPNHYILAVIGSRKFTDANYIFNRIDYLLNVLHRNNQFNSLTDVVIISGKAKGVDRIGMRYAQERGLLNINILPDWDRFPHIAGFKRNYNIIKYSHRVLAFRLNNSGGTTDSINHAIALGIKNHTIDITT